MKSNKCNHKDHQTWSRRDFLSTVGLAGGFGLTLAGLPVQALGANNLLIPPTGVEDRILILIRLKGGNDGLNMVIPKYDYGTYKANRPTIHIKENELINLSASHALPKTMQPLMTLWNDGGMKVIQNVGYPNHNLSHFTGADIWNSANVGIESDINKSGWLGRYLLNLNPNYLTNLPDVPGAIKINSGSNIAYNNKDRIDLAVNFNTIDRLIELGEKGFLYDTNNLPDNCYYGEQVGYLRSILNVTYKYAPVISNAYRAGNNAVPYSDNSLSRQLATVAKMIKGKLGTRLYMVSMEGFDTHENQNQDHPKLMNQLSVAVAEFFADISASGLDQKVLAMTFSEFGRRVEENAGGTDHGTAAPIMLFGSALEDNGILGQNADLKNLDNNGNLKNDVDFRSVYATLLESWLCIPPASVDEILGDEFERINNIGFNCTETSSQEIPLTQSLKHYVRINQDGSHTIVYDMARPGKVSIEVFTYMGHRIDKLYEGYQTEGQHEQLFYNHQLPATMCVYKINTKEGSYSGKFVN